MKKISIDLDFLVDVRYNYLLCQKIRSGVILNSKIVFFSLIFLTVLKETSVHLPAERELQLQ